MLPQTLFLIVAGLASASPFAILPDTPDDEVAAIQGARKRWAILPDTPEDEVAAVQAGKKRWAILPDTPEEEVAAVQAGKKRWAILPDTPEDEVAAVQAGKRQLGAVVNLHRTVSHHGNAKRDPHHALTRDAALCDVRYNEGRNAKRFNEELTRLQKRAGEMGMVNHEYDNLYTGEISVGNPGQKFSVVLDTGSADLWVQESNCTKCQGSKYDRAQSSSFSVPDGSPTFRINYGSGSVTGRLGRDDVSLAGYRVVKQTFGLIDEGSHILGDNGQGILGLAFQSLSNAKVTPWWVTSSTKWPQQIFAFYLRRWRHDDAATGSDDGGRLTLGYLDNSLYQGDVHYVKLLDNPKYWAVPMSKLSVGGQDVDLSGKPNVAIDTGTTHILGPEEVVNKIYEKIPNSRPSASHRQYMEYPCNQTVDDVKITFGDFELQMTNADFNAGEVKERPGWCLGTFYIGRLSSNNPVNWIFGASALKNAYTVFDNQNQQVGFAKLADGLNTPADSTGTASGGQQLLPSDLPAAQPLDEAPIPDEDPNAAHDVVTDEQASAAPSPDPSSSASPSPSSSASSSSASTSPSASPSGSSASPSSVGTSDSSSPSAKPSSTESKPAGASSAAAPSASPSEKSAARGLLPSLTALAAAGLAALLL